MPGPPPTAPPPRPSSGGSIASAFGSRVVRFVAVFVVALVVWYIYYSLERQL
jgi:hypothetical protein